MYATSNPITPRDRTRQKNSAVIVWISLATAALMAGCGSPRALPVPQGVWMLEGAPVVTTASGDDGLRFRNLRTGESQHMIPQPGVEISETAGAWVTGPGWGADANQPPLHLTLEDGELVWENGGEMRRSSRLAIREVPLAFQSGDLTLRGKLLLPDCEGPHPAVVIAHGSGRDTASATYAQPWAFAAGGIAAFVFDKRGTGSSDGDFTMNFSILADDVVQAVHAVRASGEVDPDRIGLAGYSQGGWIAPLAASRTEVAFVLVSYGMVDSPASEDRGETLEALRLAGYGEEELAHADELISVVHDIIASDFREGWDELAAVKRRFKSEPWMGEIGGFTGPFVSYPGILLRTIGKRYFPPELPFHHDSYDILAQLDVPMYWLVAGADWEAPPAETIAWLEANPRPEITWIVYPDADHGMREFVEQDRQRTYTRAVPSYYRDMVEWMRSTVDADCPSQL